MIAPKECFKAHPNLHLVTGLGLGFFLAAIFPSLANIVLGVILVILSVIGHNFIGVAKPAATPKT